MSPGKGNQFGGSHPRLFVLGLRQPIYRRSAHVLRKPPMPLRRNSGVAARLMSLGFRLYFKRAILVSVCGDLLAVVFRNVKGRNRREMIQDYCAAGKLDQLSHELLRDSLSDQARISLGKIHPTFMGGEYLPSYRQQELRSHALHLPQPHPTSLVCEPGRRGRGEVFRVRFVIQRMQPGLWN